MNPGDSGKDVAEMSHIEDQNDKLSMDKVENSVEDGKLGSEPSITWTAEEEKAALKKLDWNLIPL